MHGVTMKKDDWTLRSVPTAHRLICPSVRIATGTQTQTQTMLNSSACLNYTNTNKHTAVLEQLVPKYNLVV